MQLEIKENENYVTEKLILSGLKQYNKFSLGYTAYCDS